MVRVFYHFSKVNYCNFVHEHTQVYFIWSLKYKSILARTSTFGKAAIHTKTILEMLI